MIDPHEAMWEQIGQGVAAPFPHGWPADEFLFFSPRDPGVHGALAAVLGSAQLSVKVNMYGYDDDKLDGILREKASHPDITFQMSLDSSQAGGVHERALLAPWATSVGTSVAVGRSAKKAISHLKVAVIDGLYTISGSTNWSASGEGQQDNELRISRNPFVAARYSAVLDLNHSEMLRQMAAKRP